MSDKRLTNLTVYEKAQLVSGGGFWSTRGFEKKGVKPIKTSDGPAGLRVQAENRSDSMGLNSSVPATVFPAHSSLACSFDKRLVNAAARAIGEEARSFGVDILLAPAVNIKRNPLCGRNFEYFSEDEYLSGALGAEYIKGLQSTGVGACVKHFAANNKEYGRTVSDSVVDGRTLNEIYLTPFETCVKEAGPRAVMTAYNRLNGTFCNENTALIRDILRGQWGFDGLVISDWGGTHDRVAAIKAGADLEMPGCKFSVGEIVAAVEDGRLTEAELDECAERVIRATDLKITRKECDFGEHAAFAVECAENCAVLLKNDGVLPLDKSKTVAVIGEYAKKPVYQGGGSSHVNYTDLTNIYDCVKREYRVVGYARGYRKKSTAKRLISRAVKLAKSADVVILCAGLSASDAEGSDRKNLSLPENQLALISAVCAVGKPVVCVLSCGGAVDCPFDGGVNALLFAGLNGQGGGKAVCNILSGKVNPSGKLAEGFPADINAVESTANFNESPYYTVYREGMNVGYKGNAEYKYPFGYGLSYTSFGYSDLCVMDNGVSFVLTNTGGRDGAEAVQLYIIYPEEARSGMRLKGFEKVFLRSGESRRVDIPFDGYSFRSYDGALGKWRVVTGEYELCVGSSSRDIQLRQKTFKTGDISGVTAAKTENPAPAEYALSRDKRGRVKAELSTPFSELHASRALLVRLFVKAALGLFKNNPTVGGTMHYITLRSAAQFARFNTVQAQGFIDAFNGRYLRGAVKMLMIGPEKIGRKKK